MAVRTNLSGPSKSEVKSMLTSKKSPRVTSDKYYDKSDEDEINRVSVKKATLPGKSDERQVKSGSRAVLVRNKKGNVVGRQEDKDYAGVGTKTLKEDREYLKDKGNGQFSGGAAPRVGGKIKVIASTGGTPTGGTKKMIKASKVRVHKSAASPQAKKSALKIYKSK